MRSSVLPDYSGGGIVNLMQSIATACGNTEKRYPPLAALPATQLAKSRHVVLIVVDGLGQRTLTKHAGSPHLRRHLLGSMTSVFPSTTASAIPVFMTGLAPAQHALTGWHMHLHEVDQTLAILPLVPRHGPAIIPPPEFRPSCSIIRRCFRPWIATRGSSRRKASPTVLSTPGTRAAPTGWPTPRCRKCSAC